jgi:shikimate kinase
MQADDNIVLVGFMGTGKTSVGQCLAQRLDMTFLDMDDLIVERRGKSIPEIFSEDGEPHFRSLERELVKELAAKTGLVVGAGGGIVINPDNISDFSATGLVVCLTATPQEILSRVGSDTNRPLLAVDDKLKKINDLLESRRELYAAVPGQVDTSGLTVAEVVDKIIELKNS